MLIVESIRNGFNLANLNAITVVAISSSECHPNLKFVKALVKPVVPIYAQPTGF